MQCWRVSASLVASAGTTDPVPGLRLAMAGRSVFVSGGSDFYVYNEPHGGWSGTVPTGRDAHDVQQVDDPGRRGVGPDSGR